MMQCAVQLCVIMVHAYREPGNRGSRQYSILLWYMVLLDEIMWDFNRGGSEGLGHTKLIFCCSGYKLKKVTRVAGKKIKI